MKKILVYFYPAKNLGDDLFVKILSERYPDYRFELAVSEGYEDLKLPNVGISVWAKISEKASIMLNSPSTGKLNTLKKVFAYKILEYCRNKLNSQNYFARVLITGSLFQQPDDWDGSERVLEKYNNICPNFLIGANFGPFSKHSFLEAHREKFAECFKSVSFRDQHSYSFFSDMPNSIYAPDAVLSANFKIAPQATDNVVVSVMDFTIKPHLKEYADLYETKIAEIAHEFISKGRTVTLVSFCKKQGDDAAAERISSKMKTLYNECPCTVSYDGDIEKILELIADSCFVVATRFHSMILGWYFGKKIYPIVYGEKMLHCIEDFEYSGNFCLIEKIEHLNFSELSENFIENNDVKIEEKKIAANNHFRELDRLLEK